MAKKLSSFSTGKPQDEGGPQYLVGDHRETGNGDLEFSQSAGYGGSKFFFVEDCYINNTRGNHSPDGGMDATIGAKFVVRHCHLFNVEILCHGTELNRWRRGRAQEIYNNDYHWSYDTTMERHPIRLVNRP
ncbi:MAG: hypothetical protein DME92_02905 [Verrucomicrobia bacterium]|nr:MAG: hypothetical protein DME92_02905 [Verrucomicrobiota bacterium]